MIKNIIRMKNKFHNDIKMIKFEFISSDIRDELLNDKRILINNVSYEVSEYLAPANVLICSKCLTIGHFRKQCKQIKDTCRTCSELVEDLKTHKCSNIEKCLHCNQNHKSNSLKCSVIKSYRAELTRKVLQMNHDSSSVIPNMHPGFSWNASQFPLLATSTSSSLNNSITNKLDDLISKLSSVQSQLSNIKVKHDKFEQFMLSKNQSDEQFQTAIDKITANEISLNEIIFQNRLLIDHHENLFLKLIFPLFDDICSYLTQPTNSRIKSTNIEMKTKLERYRTLMTKAIEGKNLSI